MSKLLFGFAGLAILSIAGCDDAVSVSTAPNPEQPGPASIGYLCNMNVTEHQGPHAQVFLEGRDVPRWFSTVRDMFAYQTMAEEDQRIVVAYVSDMGVDDWSARENGAWLDARDALYVIGSSRVGGMGGSAIVPFSDETAAQAFIADFGGRIVDYETMPADVIAGTDRLNQSAAAGGEE